MARLFPQAGLAAAAVVHLWPRTTAAALTVFSWAGLQYTADPAQRNTTFETFLKFVGAYR